ncbi:uncharacterized protein TNCV_2872461 [Trichonephila clavipes]|nr:uncharacterized protein TNCV_2872461 [Trichonephila clavipes]
MTGVVIFTGIRRFYRRYQIFALLMKLRRVGVRCALNLSRAQTSFRWWGVIVRRWGCSSGVVHVTLPWFKTKWSVAKSPRVAEQCDVNIHALNLMNLPNRPLVGTILTLEHPWCQFDTETCSATQLLSCQLS